MGKKGRFRSRGTDSKVLNEAADGLTAKTDPSTSADPHLF